MVKDLSIARPTLTTRLMALALAHAIGVLFTLQAAWRGTKDRATALGTTLSLYAMTATIGSADAQGMNSSGNTAPDTILNTAVCGTGGWLTWFTSTKFLVVLLVAGLIGFFLGRAMGKRDNDGIVGTMIAVLGLGAIRILVKIVTAC